MTIYEKLLAIQQGLKAPKGNWNSFGNYSYRRCEDILEAFKPLQAQYNIVLLMRDEIVEVGGRVYVKATVDAVDPETGDHIGVTSLAREEETKKGMDSSQITGTASSYARKYALNGLFCIDDARDSDETNHTVIEEKPAPKEKLAPKSAAKPAPAHAKNDLICADCGANISAKVSNYTIDYYGRPLCWKCQENAEKIK